MKRIIVVCDLRHCNSLKPTVLYSKYERTITGRNRRSFGTAGVNTVSIIWCAYYSLQKGKMHTAEKIKYLYMQKTLAILFSMLTIFSCNPKSPNLVNNATSLPGINKAESIMGIQVKGDSSSITLSVVSNGCTQKADFTCTVINDTLLLTRLKPDYCKRMPFLLKLTWSFKEVGITQGKPFVVKNPFVGNLMLE